MTCIEKLKELYDFNDRQANRAVLTLCPSVYGIMVDPDWCKCDDDDVCKKCWNREFEE